MMGGPPTTTAPEELLSIEAQRLRSALEDRLFAVDPEPIRVGRFVIVDRIGHGGMGVVYRAFDPELGRAVALKLVTKWQREHQEGLMWEAQALARLSHPHVVAVHEVGTHAGQLFLAMELVDGLPLDRWCAQNRPPRGRRSTWARRVEGLFEQAIRGLMAAHEVGVVHRDLKPSNILVGSDGRLRLVDFGLARTDAALDHADSEPDLERSSDSTQDAGPQGAGPQLAGTPAFMAPEQFQGRADARSDEFGLCATFFEVLYGVRPYPGQCVAEIMESLERGHVIEPRDPPPVPAHLQRLLRRGLSCDRAARHGSAAGMLHALEHGRRRRARLRWTAVGTTTAAGLALALYHARAPSPQCTGAREQLVGVWDAERRGAIEQSMQGSEAPYAAATWLRIAPRLDTYAEEWVAQHGEACAASSVRGEQSPAVMDLRMGCLGRAKVELAATVQQLGRADRTTVEHAHELVGSLPRLSGCEDIEALSAAVAPPSVEVEAAVDSARTELAAARVLREAGHYEAATTQLQGLGAQAEALGYAPLRAEVELELGRALTLAGHYEASARALERALRLGLGSHQWAQAADAATVLIHVVGKKQARPEQGLAYATTAWGLLEHAPDREGEARLRMNLGTLALARGDHEEALEQHRLARRLLIDALGPTHPRVGLLHNALGSDFQAQLRHVEAEAEYRTAMQIFMEALGPDHPNIGGAHTNLGNALNKQGRHAEAELEHRAALRLWTSALGPRHPDVATAHNNLANALRAQHRLPEAEVELRAALELYQETLGSTHPRLAGARLNLGILLLTRGQPGAAELEIERALQGMTKALGADHPSVVSATHALANALRLQGELVEAEAHERQALALARRTKGEDHPEVALARAGLGMILFHQGRLDEAEPELCAALEHRIRVFGPQSLEAARSRADLGELRLAQGDADAAEVELRTALAIQRAQPQPSPLSVADVQISLAAALLEPRREPDRREPDRREQDRRHEARTLAQAAYHGTSGLETSGTLRVRIAFVLGRATWTVPGEQARARALVEHARAVLGETEGAHPRLQSAIEAWVATHRVR